MRVMVLTVTEEVRRAGATPIAVAMAGHGFRRLPHAASALPLPRRSNPPSVFPSPSPSQDDLRVHGDNMVVGLNPPFGSDTQNLASLFVLRAALFRPRLMILIVPPSTVVPAKGTWVNQPVKLGVVRDSYW